MSEIGGASSTTRNTIFGNTLPSDNPPLNGPSEPGVPQTRPSATAPQDTLETQHDDHLGIEAPEDTAAKRLLSAVTNLSNGPVLPVPILTPEQLAMLSGSNSSSQHGAPQGSTWLQQFQEQRKINHEIYKAAYNELQVEPTLSWRQIAAAIQKHTAMFLQLKSKAHENELLSLKVAHNTGALTVLLEEVNAMFDRYESVLEFITSSEQATRMFRDNLASAIVDKRLPSGSGIYPEDCKKKVHISKGPDNKERKIETLEIPEKVETATNLKYIAEHRGDPSYYAFAQCAQRRFLSSLGQGTDVGDMLPAQDEKGKKLLKEYAPTPEHLELFKNHPEIAEMLHLNAADGQSVARIRLSPYEKQQLEQAAQEHPHLQAAIADFLKGYKQRDSYMIASRWVGPMVMQGGGVNVGTVVLPLMDAHAFAHEERQTLLSVADSHFKKAEQTSDPEEKKKHEARGNASRMAAHSFDKEIEEGNVHIDRMVRNASQHPSDFNSMVNHLKELDQNISWARRWSEHYEKAAITEGNPEYRNRHAFFREFETTYMQRHTTLLHFLTPYMRTETRRDKLDAHVGKFFKNSREGHFIDGTNYKYNCMIDKLEKSDNPQDREQARIARGFRDKNNAVLPNSKRIHDLFREAEHLSTYEEFKAWADRKALNIEEVARLKMSGESALKENDKPAHAQDSNNHVLTDDERARMERMIQHCALYRKNMPAKAPATVQQSGNVRLSKKPANQPKGSGETEPAQINVTPQRDDYMTEHKEGRGSWFSMKGEDAPEEAKDCLKNFHNPEDRYRFYRGRHLGQQAAVPRHRDHRFSSADDEVKFLTMEKVADQIQQHFLNPSKELAQQLRQLPSTLAQEVSGQAYEETNAIRDNISDTLLALDNMLSQINSAIHSMNVDF